MVAIKDMEMQKDCKKCPLMGTDGNPKDLFSPMMCVAIWATTHEIKHCVEGKILDDCPLVEIEERKVGKWIEHKQKVAIGYREFIACPFCKCWFGKWELHRNSYCPNCGAEMRGVENE